MMPQTSRSTFLQNGFVTALSTVAALPALSRQVFQASDSSAQSVAISIDRSRRVGALIPGSVGLSYEKSKVATGYFSRQNAQLVGLFKRLGPSTLRIGGNTSDKIGWLEKGPGQKRGQTSASDVDALADFLRECGWNAIYGIDLPTNTPEEAAAEAAYVAKSLGDRLSSFEIGNEPDAYTGNGLRTTTYSFTDFLADWTRFANEIKHSAPDCSLSGPASAYRTDDWTIPFATAEATRISLLTEHFYDGDGKSAKSTIPQLLGSTSYLEKVLKSMRSASLSNNIRGGFRLTEANSLYSGGASGVSNAVASALWVVDFLMLNAQYGSRGANLHGGADGTYNAFYTPIADLRGVVSEIRPLFYGMLFVSNIAPGAMNPTTITSTLNVSAYAVDGHAALSVVIVNKEPQATADVVVNLGVPYYEALVTTLSGPALDALSGVTLGGASIGLDGSWSPARDQPIPVNKSSMLSVRVPAGSAIRVKIAL